MIREVLGFLSIKGWSGVQNIFFLTAMGTIIGMGLVYFFLVYQKDPKPKPRITIKGHLGKIFFLLVILIAIMSF